MARFQVGDIIRISEDGRPFFFEGDEGIVIAAGHPMYSVDFTHNPNHKNSENKSKWAVRANKMELVQ